jgi:hypothetical protein
LNRLALARFVGLWGIVLAAGLLMHGYVRGLYQGGATVLFLAMLGLSFLVHTDALSQLVGTWGEDNTRHEIDIARKNGCIWGAVHNIEFGGQDIDHLVFMPAGVVAVESKWRRYRIDASTLQRDVQQAIYMARRGRLLLQSRNIGASLPVDPLLVVWGRGGRDIPGGEVVVDGVTVLAGPSLHAWFGRRVTGALARETAEDLQNKLTHFRDNVIRG